MAKIENIHQLHAEIERMEEVCKLQENKLREDLQEFREDFTPLNIILNTISSLTGVRLEKKEFMKDGIGFGLSLFFQRLIMRTEKAVENKVYDFVDTAVESIKKFMSKAVDPSERRKARMDEREDN